MPENCVYIGRPSKWSNPFKVDELGIDEAVKRFRECILNNSMAYYYFYDLCEATIQYNHFKWISENLSLLKGKDIACWCKLSDKCHSDVLIDLVKSLQN